MAITSITTDLYLLRCITNLHAGSGDTNYGIVDKTVQRDPLDYTPVIHASGIKGALREAFTFMANDDNDPSIETIFGTDTKTMNTKPEKARAGQFHFYGARLLFLPVRTNRGQYFLATTQNLLQNFQNAVSADFGINLSDAEEILFNALLAKDEPEKGKPCVFIGNVPDVLVDEYEASDGGRLSEQFEDIQAARIALFNKEDFQDICQNRLPVIARNQLDNGISANLWYEEVVPREARFYFFVARPSDQDDLQTGLGALHNRIQIGGNASVGYGLCELKRIKSSSEQ